MVTKTFKFSNGDEVREKVSGFRGIITGSVYYLTGCSQYLVTAKPKDEFSEPVGLWYDEGRLELLFENVHSRKTVQSDDNGCDIILNCGARGF
jgi:hypothetical protein